LTLRAATTLLAVSALCLGACATAPPAPEPRRPFLPYQLAPQQPVTEEAAATGKPEEPTWRIDASLIRFAVDQRQTRYIGKPGELMPASVRAGWSEVLGEVDKLLRLGAKKTIPLDVIRARVALDAELEMDREHYFALPDGLAASVHARSQALDQRLAEIRKLTHPSLPAATRLSWPIDPVVVTSLFGMRADPFSGDDHDHQGLDLKADKGQLIQAAAAGTVVRSGRWGGYGLHVEIDHGDGLITTYSHLSTVLVAEGTHVPAHGPVGLAGSTGRSTGPHLHFEVWRDGVVVDPLGELPDPAVEALIGGATGGGEGY
jgi:murein DD-endopeptidase MepM/ murein hydrolase activator NlpD